MTDHPITLPLEIASQWVAEIYGDPVLPLHPITLRLLERAAQWGADEELEACRMEIIDGAGLLYIDETSHRVCLAEDIRNTRRPKPPSLKEQALMALEDGDTALGASLTSNEVDIIRRALEALPDDLR